MGSCDRSFDCSSACSTACSTSCSTDCSFASRSSPFFAGYLLVSYFYRCSVVCSAVAFRVLCNLLQGRRQRVLRGQLLGMLRNLCGNAESCGNLVEFADERSFSMLS